jgi:hypothetical protein
MEELHTSSSPEHVARLLPHDEEEGATADGAHCSFYFLYSFALDEGEVTDAMRLTPDQFWQRE